MNRALLEPIVRAVLYEGYILYPYRPSVKNVHRWTFGGVFPRDFVAAQAAGRSGAVGDASFVQTQCIVRGDSDTRAELAVRFLHLIGRTVAELVDGPPDGAQTYRPVQALEVAGTRHIPWQEAQEREVDLGAFALADLLAGGPLVRTADFPARLWQEKIADEKGRARGLLLRRQEEIRVNVSIGAAKVAERFYRLTVRVENQTPIDPARRNREEVMLSTLVSTHTLLGSGAGMLVSMTDPPKEAREAVAGCRNIGAWPVLVGGEREADTMLSSPIILEDNPRIAPESPGDFFDGTEIDEMLTLRILTLTDEEKRDMAAVDPLARALLERTTAQEREAIAALHGALREPMA